MIILKNFKWVVLIIINVNASAVFGQTTTEATPSDFSHVSAVHLNDVSSISNLTTALYAVISGPAGPRDWSRFENLFAPGAYMGASQHTSDGKRFHLFSPREYAKMNAPLFSKFSFTEKELSRAVHKFGSIAQIFSSYEFTLSSPKPLTRRGINSLQMINEKGRWWILMLIWDEETADNVIPPNMLIPQ